MSGHVPAWVEVEVSVDDNDQLPSIETWIAASGDALLRFAYLMTGDRERAADAVQDALVAACPRWARIVMTGDPGAYLRRCVVNADTSRWRKSLRRERPVADVADFFEPTTDDVSQQIVTEDATWALCKSLPAKQRAAVVLRYYEDCSDAEIAVILNCSVSTVRSQIHRGLASLRKRLHEQKRVEA